jgi:flagellar biosynthesis anti-sigma factor FlgM
MKVQGPDLSGKLKELLEALRSREKTGAKGSGAAEGPQGASASDRVDLSPRARELRLMAEALEREPEVRQALVESLREEIRTGRYAPDGRVIADALLEESGEDEIS